MYPSQDRSGARIGQYEYVIADMNEGLARRYEPSADPCQSREEECAEWVRERMTALYNE